MLWIGLLFLGFLVLDIWDRHKKKNKTLNTVILIIEGSIAFGFIIAWYLKNF